MFYLFGGHESKKPSSRKSTPGLFGHKISRGLSRSQDDRRVHKARNSASRISQKSTKVKGGKKEISGSKSQPIIKASSKKLSTKRSHGKPPPAFPVRSLGSLCSRGGREVDEGMQYWQADWQRGQRKVLRSSMEGPTRLVRAKYAFKATNNDELSFQKSDTITLTQPIEGGWWEGTLGGKTGWFPSNYVIELQTEEAALSPTVTAVAALSEIPVKEQHHLLVTKHLVESEAEYVNELQTLMKQYLRPLPATNVITSQECQTLCGNLTELISFQQRFLQSLTDCSNLAVSQQRIGGIFLANAPQVKTLYHSYAANHPNSISLLAQYREELSTYMESHGSTTPGAQALTGYLSSPFRRLDKYPALLKELERHIDDAHADRGDTQRALAVYKEIQTATVDVRKDKEMELEVLSAEIKNWEGEDLLSLGDVHLSAHVKVHTDNSGSSSDRIILMFPACILMISVSPRMSYYYQGKVMLSGLKVKKLEDTDTYSNALQLSGTMIEEMIVSFNSQTKWAVWFDHISNLSKQNSQDTAPSGKPKSVQSSTMPPQVTSKARVQTISSSAKTAQVIDSYDRLGLNGSKIWTLSCLRPLPPSRPQFVARDDTKSPKLQRKASTLGRRKNNVDDSKVLQEDAKILKVIESYCTSARTRHTVNSSILDSPNMLIAEDEKIICEVTKDNQTIIEERSLVDTVYVIKDQIKDLQSDYEKLKKELEDERKARKKLESIVHKSMQSSSLIPLATLNHNHNESGQ